MELSQNKNGTYNTRLQNKPIPMRNRREIGNAGTKGLVPCTGSGKAVAIKKKLFRRRRS